MSNRRLILIIISNNGDLYFLTFYSNRMKSTRHQAPDHMSRKSNSCPIQNICLQIQTRHSVANSQGEISIGCDPPLRAPRQAAIIRTILKSIMVI